MKKILLSIVIAFLIINTTWASSITAEMIYAKAYGALFKGNTKEAIRILEKSKNYYPDCAFLYAGLGDAYLKEKNFDKAIENYYLAQTKKDSIDIYKIDFYNANLQKNMQAISASLNELFEATKTLDKPVLYENINLILNEEYTKTQILSEMYLNTQDSALNQINNIKAGGKSEQALQGYLKILSANPKDFRAANNAGVTLYELNDFELAEKYFLLGLENNPNSPIILNNLAIINLYKGDFKKMDEYLSAALKAEGNYLPAINNKAVLRIYKELSLYKTENVQTIIDIIKRDFENHYATRVLSKIYFVKGDFKSADVILEALDSSYNFKLYTQKAYSALKNNELNKALDFINKAIELYSDNSVDYEVRGRIYSEMQDYQNAILSYKTALEKEHKSANIKYFYARTLYASGQKTLATTLMKEFVSAKKGNSQSSNLKLFFE